MVLGYPFLGLLFTGFMLTPTGPKVLEYNVRFGDPETEALMLLLSDETDLVAICLVRRSFCFRGCEYNGHLRLVWNDVWIQLASKRVQASRFP